MIDISVSSDISRALEKLSKARDGVVGKAVVNAINRTAEQIKEQIGREIQAAGYGIPATVISNSITLYRAGASGAEAILMASKQPIPLIQYNARQESNGVTVAVHGGRKLIQHAFITTTHRGYTGVFRRRERSGKAHEKVQTKDGRWIWSAVAIEELYGPSVLSAGISKAVQTALEASAVETFPRQLQQEINRLQLK